jgi:acetylcholinesterase
MISHLLLLIGLCTIVSALVTNTIVHSKAGIFHGRFLPEFDQELFLGVRFAPKPERFAPADLAKDAPESHHNATQYGTDCHGYGSDTNLLVKAGWTRLGEDCLHLNIIKPHTDRTSLPVLIWIYGGGWQQGATSDPRYVQATNLAFPLLAKEL